MHFSTLPFYYVLHTKNNPNRPRWRKREQTIEPCTFVDWDKTENDYYYQQPINGIRFRIQKGRNGKIMQTQENQLLEDKNKTNAKISRNCNKNLAFCKNS